MVYGNFQWFEKIKRYGLPTAKEWRDIFITIFALAFVLGFDDGRETFNLALWFGNYIIMVGVVALSLGAHELARRTIALRVGFRPEFKMWPNGLVLSIILVFVSMGNFWYFLPIGGLFCHHLVGHRLGYFRYGLNVHARAIANMVGPLANIVVATIFKNINLYLVPGNPIPLFDYIFLVNLWFAVTNILPLPTLAGGDLFYYSRPTYVFLAGTIIAYAIMVTGFALYSWVLALLIGVIVWGVFMLTFEKSIFWDSK